MRDGKRRRGRWGVVRVWLALCAVFAALATFGERGGVAQAAVPRGKADVFASPASLSGLSGAPGTTFTLDVVVEPSGVSVDAASVAATFDPRFLAVDAADVAPGDQFDTELQRVVDNAQGSLFFAAGKLGGPWPDTAFTLASITFRFVATPSTPLTVTLVTSGRPATEVVSNGASVLNAARGSTVSIGTASAASGGGTSGGGTSGGSSGGAGSGGGSSAGSGGGGGASSSATSGSGGGNASVSGRTAAAAPAASPTAVGGPSPLASTSPAVSAPAVRPFPPGALPSIPASVQVGAAPVAPPFVEFYAQRQGLRVLGNTLGGLRTINGIAAQYFEKGRAEDHPEEPNTFWRVQYGLLVDELVGAAVPLPVGGDASTLTYADIQQVALAGRRVPPPPGFIGGTAVLPDGSVFVPFSAALLPEAGHFVPANFWAYINNLELFPGGWLHDVGLPIAEPVEAVVDKGPATGRRIVVQAFQRTVLTFDPLNPPDYWVERANVGTDYTRAFPEQFNDQPGAGGQ